MIQATNESLALIAAQLQNVDLLFLHQSASWSFEPGQIIHIHESSGHARSNLLTIGTFANLCSLYRHLQRTRYASYELVLPLNPSPTRFQGHAAVQNHLLALLAYHDPAHIENLEQKIRGGHVLGGGTLIQPKEAAQSLPQLAELIPELLIDYGFYFSAEVPSEPLAHLIERYSNPGGMVVTSGLEAPRIGMLAALMGRQVLVALNERYPAARYMQAMQALLHAYDKHTEPPAPTKGASPRTQQEDAQVPGQEVKARETA